MSIELKSLVQQRGTIKARITIFSKYLSTVKLIEADSIPKQIHMETEIKLSRFKELLTQFDDIKTKIEGLDPDQLEENDIIESDFCSNIAKAQLLIESFAPRDVVPENTNCNSISSCQNGKQDCRNYNIKLPTIQLPSFDGNYLKWMEFRDTFDSLINNNNTIPDINKFHYLRSSLEEGASDIIKSIEFTAANYKLAWSLLTERFDNNRILTNNHLKAILNFETITKENYKSLRTMIDYYSKNIRALSSLNDTESRWDILLVYIMASKLDGATGRTWEEHRSTIAASPTIEEFYNFLRNRADVLETLQYSKNDAATKTEKRSYSKDNKQTKSFVSSSNTKGKGCVICSQDHLLYKCDKFKDMSLDARYSEVSKHKLCHNCLRPGHYSAHCKHNPCKICNKKHNLLLHKSQSNNDKTNSPVDTSSAAPVPHEASTSQTSSTIAMFNPVSLSAAMPGQILLCTAQVELIDSQTSETHTVRALLDNGSQSSFITEKMQRKLNLSCSNTNISIAGINNKLTNTTKRCNIKLKSRINLFHANVSCLLVPDITGMLPSSKINPSEWNIPKSIELADPTYYVPSEIDLLLGADIYWEIVDSKQIKLGKNKPTLLKSKLGWLVSGPTGVSPTTTTHSNFSQEIRDSLTKFWEVEDVPALPTNNNKFSNEEQYCENHFIENTIRLSNGRFCVKLPLREVPSETLGDSYVIAKRRFLNLERKLNKSKIKDDYTEFINEYKRLGHLTEVSRPSFGYYIPHHAVIRESSETTRLRVVFDASCKTSTSKSLNDIQFVGPVVQDDLMAILLRFRQYTYVVTGDIEKMYRQVMVHESQRHLQLILWREDESQPLKTLQLNTVTYGTASAPYLSTRCLVQLAAECTDEAVANTIRHDFYVDDLNTGSDSKSLLRANISGVIDKLAEGCFPLRKFRTNSPDIFDGIPTTDQSQDFSKQSSVLGLKWTPSSDTLHYSVEIESIPKVTKRSILSNSCRIFDPLGLLSACTIFHKIILQRLWLLDIGWDDEVPKDIQNSWLEFYNETLYFAHIQIPRYIFCSSPIHIAAHCFTDASQDAYGACIYLKSTNSLGEVKCNLLCAKTKVSPLKSETIPRLELLGALLGAKLYSKVLHSLKIKISCTVFWTDSTIVLGWLHTPPKTLKTYVSNRIEQIRELTDITTWRHVPSEHNPADMASRGIQPRLLDSNTLWWHGPSFLTKSEHEWPQPKSTPSTLPEIKIGLNIILYADIIPFQKYSKLYKLQRICAYILRFINNIKNSSTKLNGELTCSELNNSLILLAKASQREYFSKEIHSLETLNKLNSKSRVLSLNPFLDKHGVLRVGGRIDNASYCPYGKRHPILLDPKHTFTKRLFEQEHLRLLHCGPQQLLNTIREQFWPTGGKVLAATTVRKCVRCQRFRAKPLKPIMGNLPQPRVTPAPPFATCGTDFAGPFLILNRKGRGAKTSKCYLCIFVCFSTKAVHLEVVSDLSSDAFILCLRRFISRRSKPHTIYCDNGKNFVGASNELNRLLKENERSVSDYASKEGITFKFSPAYAPHFGGIWEAGVKTAKYHLKRIAGNSSLTFEELYTLFAQIEAIMNSRPITSMSADPSDLSALTPGHFLVGRPLTSLPSPIIQRGGLNRYKLIERLKNHFWSRWRKDYLTTLQQRVKWQRKQDHVRVGDLVFILDDQLPPMKWLMGRITKLYPGADGVCRVVDVKTEYGVIHRPVSKLSLLDSQELLGEHVPKGGEDVRNSTGTR